MPVLTRSTFADAGSTEPSGMVADLGHDQAAHDQGEPNTVEQQQLTPKQMQIAALQQATAMVASLAAACPGRHGARGLTWHDQPHALRASSVRYLL